MMKTEKEMRDEVLADIKKTFLNEIEAYKRQNNRKIFPVSLQERQWGEIYIEEASKILKGLE